MNEPIARENQMRFRRGLLATVSALALCGAAYRANAADDSHPPFWIELGGQFTQEQTDEEIYSPPFFAGSPFIKSVSSLGMSARASWDGTAKLAYETDNGWLFSVAILYGKTNRNGTANHQTAHASHYYNGKHVGGYDAYQLLNVKTSQSHTIMDFQAGKDVGLGSFGDNGNSVLNLGVRIAQFNTHLNATAQSQPTNINGYGYYHIFRAKFAEARRFNGVGPSLSWDASTTLLGKPSSSSIALDWGVNGAVLFGRQYTSNPHQTTDNYKHYYHYLKITTAHGGGPRSRNVVVQDLGGFAGVSWRYSSAKVAFGYRADFFFGAIDGGIDTAKKENVGFYGPFASVSVGIGG
jgi:hypothetical protein